MATLAMIKDYFEPIADAHALDDHRVEVVFAGGEKGVFDCSAYFGMGYYRKLNDPAFFKCVHVSYGDLAENNRRSCQGRVRVSPDYYAKSDIGGSGQWRNMKTP